MYSRNEDLVTLAKGSRKLPNFIWATLLVLIFMTGGQIIGGICIVPIYLIMYMTRRLFNWICYDGYCSFNFVCPRMCFCK